MRSTLNVGVIGLGLMGARHALALDKMPLVNLKSICDANEERLQAYSEKLKVKGYKDYKEMLDDEELDAVSICLPDNMHLDVVKTAVDKKKHILVEKPIASELNEGKQIYELVKDYDKVFTVGHIVRFDPRFSEVKRRISEGQLGDIIYLYCRRNSPITGPKHYKGFTDLSMHVMIHDIDIVNWFFNSNPVKVYAKSRSALLKEYNMTDCIFALIEYENGAIACLEACWVLPENLPGSIDDKVEVVGTKGVAYIDSCDKGVNFIAAGKVDYPDSRHWPDVNGEIGGALYEELTSFVNCVIKGRKPVVSAYDAVKALEIVDAIERSRKGGCEIRL